MVMNMPFGRLLLLATATILPAAGFGQEPERTMNLAEGPDAVFADAPAEIFSELAGARATNENGRVGSELVFWGYHLADGRDAYLVACAVRENVDCAAREQRVCPTRSEVIARDTHDGIVHRRRCTSISLVAPGDVRPGCTDREGTEALAVSLVSCL